VSLRRIAVLIGILSLSNALPAVAQPDIIRGKITGPDGQPMEKVTVTATSIADQTFRTVQSKADGTYSMLFNPGSGDYLMTASMVGFQPAPPKEIRDDAGTNLLVWNVTLNKPPIVLNAITTQAVRQRPDLNNADLDAMRNGGGGAGANDFTLNMNDLMSGGAGDLASLAANMPGVTYIPGVDGGPAGFSVLGLGADQNLTMLNGLVVDGSMILPDGTLGGGRVTTGGGNAAVGGASGAVVSVSARAGDNFIRQSASYSARPSFLQFLDQAGQQLGQSSNSGTYTAQRSGPIVFGRNYYSATFSYNRTTSDLATLLNTDELGLARLGISKDSVDRLKTILSEEGIPITVSALPKNRVNDGFSSALRFDLNPSGTQNYTIVGTGGMTRNLATGLSSQVVPARGGESRNYSSSLSLQTSFLLFNNFMNSATVGGTFSRQETSAYETLPAATVRVNSTLEDGTNSITTLQIGGNSSAPTNTTRYSIQGSDQFNWYSVDNKHSLQASGNFNYGHTTVDNVTNRLGSLSYLSLADLESNTPNQFRRTVLTDVRKTQQLSGTIGLTDNYRPTPNLNITFGANTAINKIMKTPEFNPKIDSIFGIRNDNVPTGIFISPRSSFRYQFGNANQISAFVGQARQVRSTLNGSLGMFLGSVDPQLVEGAAQATGLPRAIQTITCTGEAVPNIDWAAIANDPSLIPDTCADGTGATGFSTTTPNVTLISKDWKPTRRYTASLGYNTTPSWGFLPNRLTNRYSITLNGSLNYNVDQRGSLDLNFDNTPEFFLAGEDNRPVFAPVEKIQTRSGTISSAASRKTSAFTSVNASTSDTKQRSGQFQVSVRPYGQQPQRGFRWSNVSYTYLNSSEYNRGFSLNTFGDPLELSWAKGSSAAHQFGLSFNYLWLQTLQVTFSPSLRSGSPYTPTVDRDINGDGRANDRAFLFDPSTPGLDTALSNGMNRVLSSTSESARECLLKDLGGAASRNGCSRPWFFNMGLGIRLFPDRLKLPQRATLNIGVNNPLTAIDAAYHGGWDRAKGWGSQPQIETQLLSVRGFDSTNKQFLYEVNERFGQTRSNQVQRSAPFSMNFSISYNLGPEIERQQLDQWLATGRTRNGAKRNEGMWRTTYSNQIRNPFNTLLQQTDSLKLTEDQADSIAMINKSFQQFQDSLWQPLAKYLAELPNDYNADEAWARVKDTWYKALDRLAILGPKARNLLTDDQYRMLPSLIANQLDADQIRNQRPGNAAGQARAGGGRGGSP
jgi:hypothetical protein